MAYFCRTVKVLAYVPYPIGKGPSQRFRLEIFQERALKDGITFHLRPFYDETGFSILYKKRNYLNKAWCILRGYFSRYLSLLSLYNYDMVYIQRETSPIGPPVFAWLIAKVFRKRYVYDIDDAIWLPNFSAHNATFHHLKAYWKTKYLIRWSAVTSAGNQYLAEYARKENDRVVILPTVVDTVTHHRLRPQDKLSSQIKTIGWTGTHTTMSYLDPLIPIFHRLEKKFQFRLLVISNQRPHFELASLEFRKWNAETEVSDLHDMDLGLMPMLDERQTEFIRGKCGFKLIQYLSIGIPALASDIGVNKQIIKQGENGFLCATVGDWEKRLSEFLTDPSSMTPMGSLGRKTIESNYSVVANYRIFKSLFKAH